MADNSLPDDAGGFVRALPSPMSPTPAPSTTTSTTRSLAGLPKPRARPIRPGSAKEDQVRNFVEERLLHISRRYVKKFGLVEPGDEVVGYPSFAALVVDLENIINIIWLTGTRKSFNSNRPHNLYILLTHTSQSPDPVPAQHRERVEYMALLFPALPGSDLLGSAQARPLFREFTEWTGH